MKQKRTINFQQKHEEKAPVKKPRSLVAKGIELDDLDSLRTLYWLRRLVAIGQCQPSKLPVKYVMDIGSPEFDLYARGRRQPAPETLAAVDRSHTVMDASSRPFKGSKELFEMGPGGKPLWAVLSGDVGACSTVVDDFFKEEFGATGLLNSNFQEKIDYMFSSLLLTSQIDEVKDALDFKGNMIDVKRYCYRHIVMDKFSNKYPGMDFKEDALEQIFQEVKEDEAIEGKIANMELLLGGMDWFAHPFLLNNGLNIFFPKHYIYMNYRKAQKYNYDVLVAGLALRVVAYANKTNIKEADYLMVGIVRVLMEKMPEIADELLAYMKKQIKQFTSKLHGLS